MLSLFPTRTFSFFLLTFGSFGVACSASPSDGVDSVDGSGGTTSDGGSSSTGGAALSSGGTTGNGGSTSAGGSASGGSTGNRCEDADILCETFDAALPSSAPWLARNCTESTYSMSISTGAGETGSGALLTSGAAPNTNIACALHADLGELTDVWVRAIVQITGASPSNEHEVTFFELGPNLENDPELRIGYRGDNSCSNSGAVHAGFELGATQGPGGEFTGCTGVVPESNRWYCLEVHLDQSGDEIAYSELFADGTKLDTLVHSQPKERVEGSFKSRYLKVGMQSYSGKFDGLLIDEIAVSTRRLPCP